MGELPIVPFLIIFPLVIAFLMFFVIKHDKVRSFIAYCGAIIIIAAVGVLTFLWFDAGAKPITLYMETEIADYAILLGEIILMCVVTFLSFKYKKYWISLLSIAPTAAMVWLEFLGPETAKLDHIYIDRLSILMIRYTAV